MYNNLLTIITIPIVKSPRLWRAIEKMSVLCMRTGDGHSNLGVGTIAPDPRSLQSQYTDTRSNLVEIQWWIWLERDCGAMLLTASYDYPYRRRSSLRQNGSEKVSIYTWDWSVGCEKFLPLVRVRNEFLVHSESMGNLSQKIIGSIIVLESEVPFSEELFPMTQARAGKFILWAIYSCR